MKKKYDEYKDYLNKENIDINNKNKTNINNSSKAISNKMLIYLNNILYINRKIYLKIFMLIKYNNHKNNMINKTLKINNDLLFLLWNFIIVILVYPIVNEKVFNNNRKLESIQSLSIIVTNGTKLKIINSDYIPNNIYINGVNSFIEDEGYVNIISDSLLNNVILEWNEKREKYTKLFRDIDSLIEVDFTNFDSSGVTSISNMFINCRNLKHINFTNFDTSSVYDMSSMFENCASLESIDLSNFDTSNVKIMDYMFKNCISLISLDLKNFRTPLLTTMNEMFSSCIVLKYIDLSNFDTSLVTSMSSLFLNCNYLTSINIVHFITINVKFMNELFMNCGSLKSIDLSKMDTSNTLNMSSMFYGCSSLISLNLSNFNTLKVENMEYMFYNCKLLKFLDISNFDISDVVSMKYMFSQCSSLISLDLTNLVLSQKNLEYLFEDCKSLVSIKFSRKYKLLGKIDKMFYGCSSLTTLDLYNFDFGFVDNMEDLFRHCSSLVSLDLSNIDTFSVTTMKNMFYGCTLLKTINLKKWNTKSLLEIDNMFNNCISLISLDLSTFKTSLVKDMSYIFYNCNNLTSLNISSFDTSKVITMKYMFYRCISLTSLDLSNFNTSLVNNMDSMFEGCTSLISLDLSRFNTKNLEIISYMFRNCINLEYINISFFDDRNMYSYNEAFEGTTDNLVYCIYNSSNNEQIRKELSLKNCSINDCSIDWKINKMKIIPEKETCIKDCFLDDIYNYEYKYICYEQCPKGTHSNNENIYLCELNAYECFGKYPFIIVIDNSCEEECHLEDFFKDICTINTFINQTLSNSQSLLISTIIKDIEDGVSKKLLLKVVFKEKNDIMKIDNDILYQITSNFNQNNKEYENISTIKLGECENILKEKYNLSLNESLIIFKTEQYIEDLYIPLIEYDIFNPKTNEKLNLDYCRNENISIEINIPVSINESDLILFETNNSYYNDICYIYTTDKGTDITLYDRQNEFNNNNISLCPKNCIYKEFDSINSKVTCLCQLQDRFSLFSNINKNEILYNFIITKKMTNFDVLKCYKLLFSKDGLIKNAGNYIILIIIITYIILLIYFYQKEYILFYDIINEIINAKIIQKDFDISSKTDIKEEFKENSTELLSSSKKSKVSNLKNNSNKYNIETKVDSEISGNKNILNNNNNNKNDLDKSEIEKTMEYIDYEINTISYKEAIENDKRTYFQYYKSLIKLNNILIFTFNRNKDYNSYIIKICLLFFSITLYMSVNTLFFNDSFMHRIYLDKGIYNFKYALPKIIYSLLISPVIMIIFRKIFLTHQNILEIKHEKNKFKLEGRVTIELRNIKIKFACFFILSFLFLLLFWYYLSSFCAVYKNTQIYIFENTLICYTISLIYPFIICLLPGLFRMSAFKSPGECLYKISQIIQWWV